MAENTDKPTETDEVSSVPPQVAFLDQLAASVEHLQADGKPNINRLWIELKELNAIKWSVKQQGYAIGAEVYKRVAETSVPSATEEFVLPCKPSTQSDVESPWFRYWMNQIHSAPLPHRKLWEFAYILQNMYSLGVLKDGHRALGFGCGEEPLPSYFASKGINVTVTDLHPEMVAGQGWAETGQHTATVESSYHPNLLDRTTFDERVELQFVDMNDIPAHLDGQYDFCWSVCALEHLGSVKNGLDFIENSLRTLKPGGVAIHTTEFSYTETDRHIDNWPTVLFLKRHFEDIRGRLKNAGHDVQDLDFYVGTDPLDTFVDVPPYNFDQMLFVGRGEAKDRYLPGHLKLSVDGFPSTCFGVTIRKAQ